MAVTREQLKLINGNGREFKEAVGRQLVTAILHRDDAKYEKLRSTLHPTINLTVVSSLPSDTIDK